MNIKFNRLLPAAALLLLSAVLFSTASFAWFSMNTTVNATGFEFEAVSDSMFLEISNARDGVYSTSVDMNYGKEKTVRLSTLAHLSTGAVTISAAPVASGTRYTSASGKSYYHKVTADSERVDTYEGENYIKINDKLKDASSVFGFYNFDKGNISFSLVTSTAPKFDGTGSYYKKAGNTYYKLSLPDSDGVLDNDELELNASLRGMYTVTFGSPEGANAKYDGVSLYYEEDENGNVSPVGALHLGSLLDGYYTLTASAPIYTAAADTKYYIQNSQGDYVCIGTPGENADLGDYYYWAKAYSGALGAAVTEDTIRNVIKSGSLDNYYLADTLYLRVSSPDKHGRNLRIADVNVDGGDSLTGAIRVYFEARNGAGKLTRAFYNNRTGTVTYADGRTSLADEILSNKQEIIEVKVYIYYDGADASAKTENVRLSGHSLSLSFEVDYPNYQ